MKAAVLRDYGEKVVVEDLVLEEPRAGEVRVRIQAAGVCHSDLHVLSADLPLPVPIVLGHEGAGIVEAVGPGVTRVKPGDHVVLSWIPECGECFYCKIGRYDMCETAVDTAVMGTMPDGTTRFSKKGEEIYQFSLTGTFAEATVVPESGVIKIRDDIPFERAALVGCGVMTGVGAVVNTAQVKPGSSVAVIGAGGVGLNVIQGAALAGAERIIAVDKFPKKLEFAKKFGATHFVNAAEQDVVSAVLDLTNGRGADYAFEVIGLPATMAQAYNCVRKAGMAVIVGVAPPNVDVCINAFSIPSSSKILTGSWYGQANPQVDILKMLDLYVAGKLNLDDLVTNLYTIDQVNEAFDAMKNGEVARGVIRF